MTTPAFLTGGYSPPGVYVTETPTTQVTSTGIPPSDVAIVGPGIGYQSYTEQVVLTTTDAQLAQQGIDLTSIVVVRTDTSATLTVSADYTAVQGAGSGQTYHVTVARVIGGALTADTLCTISYRYTTPDYYMPRVLDNFGDVKAVFGEPLALTAPTAGDTSYVPVTSPISLAAKVAFENGAGELILCAATPPDPSLTDPAAISAAQRSALSDAYVKIATNYSAALIVPVTDGLQDSDTAAAGNDLRAHVETSSADGYYRMGLLGFDPTVATAPDQIISAGSFSDSRMVLAYACPQGMAYYNGSANQNLTLGHQYLAAAYAGLLSALPVQQGLTKQVIRSFAGLGGIPVSASLKNRYASGGVAITEADRLGNTVCRHGVTTMGPTNLTSGEISLVRTNDYLLQLIQIGTDQAGLIGTPITADTPDSIKAVVAGLLEHASLQGAILGYTGLAVRQESVNPSVMEVEFAYQPAYPINYISIVFSIDTTTGLTSTEATSTTSGSTTS